MTERRSLVVVLHDDDGTPRLRRVAAVRAARSTPTRPWPAHGTCCEHVLIPRVVGPGVRVARGARCRAAPPGVRGNPFARAALETAAWDLEATVADTGLAALLAERLGVDAGRTVPCGVALGIPVDRSTDTLQRWIADAVARGYRRVKIKVAPGWDASPGAAAREVLAGTGLPLTVDANGGYEWPEHERELRALDEAELLYIEQPLHPDELVGHARLAERLRTQVCVDETLRDARAARQIAELGGPLVWNVKVHRVGGLTEVCRDRPASPAGAAPDSGPGPCPSRASAPRRPSRPRRCRSSCIPRIWSRAPAGSAATPTSSSSR